MAHTREQKEMAEFRATMRNALADYIASEGCGCCGDRDKHNADADRLGKLLNVPKYADGSGYDFSKYRTVKRK